MTRNKKDSKSHQYKPSTGWWFYGRPSNRDEEEDDSAEVDIEEIDDEGSVSGGGKKRTIRAKTKSSRSSSSSSSSSSGYWGRYWNDWDYDYDWTCGCVWLILLFFSLFVVFLVLASSKPDPYNPRYKNESNWKHPIDWGCGNEQLSQRLEHQSQLIKDLRHKVEELTRHCASSNNTQPPT